MRFTRRLRNEHGVALFTVLIVLLLFGLLSVLVMLAVSRELNQTAAHEHGVRAFEAAEAGAITGRAALLAYLGKSAGTSATFSGSIATALSGVISGDRPLEVFNYLRSNGLSPLTPYSGTGETTCPHAGAAPYVDFHVNLGAGSATVKLQSSPATNVLEPTSQQRFDTIVRIHETCNGPGGRAVAATSDGASAYLRFEVISTGRSGLLASRTVRFTKDFTLAITQSSFAKYALFTDDNTGRDDTGATTGELWFVAGFTELFGPVHTNRWHRFFGRPRFHGELTQADRNAQFWSCGTIDAYQCPPDHGPLMLDGAAWKRGSADGVSVIPLPSNTLRQARAAFGGDPYDASTAITTTEIMTNLGVATATVYTDSGCATSTTIGALGGVPPDLFVRPNATLSNKLGFYLHNDAQQIRLTASGTQQIYQVTTPAYTQLGGTDVYYLEGGVCTQLNIPQRTVTITVDHATGQTTADFSNGRRAGWDSLIGRTNPTMSYSAVPHGMFYVGEANMEGSCSASWASACTSVKGNVFDLQGPARSGATVNPAINHDAQITLFALKQVQLQGDLKYQTTPDPADPTSNPPNMLGVYSHWDDIVIWDTAPNDVVLDGVYMASGRLGASGTSLSVRNYWTGGLRGRMNVFGSVIMRYANPTGTFNPGCGCLVTGYEESYIYDTRLGRGFAPPFFPTTGAYMPDSVDVGQTWTWSETAR